MLRKGLLSILFGLATGYVLGKSQRQDGQPASEPAEAADAHNAELVRRMESLENTVAAVEHGLQELAAERSKEAGSLRDWVEQRLATMDGRLAHFEDGQAGDAARRLEGRMRQHAEAIQQLEDRVVCLERSSRELGLRLERMPFPPAVTPGVASLRSRIATPELLPRN